MNFLKSVFFDDDNEEETDEEPSKEVVEGEERVVAENAKAVGPEDSGDAEKERTVDEIAV